MVVRPALPDEQSVFDRCSVFAGGFDLRAAVAVAGVDEFDVLDLLGSLVRKSLIMAERVAAGTRYSMLETIRQFAEERLAASGLSDEIETCTPTTSRPWNGP